MEDILKKFDFWFSQKVSKYYVVANSSVKFTDDEVIVDWDHCLVDIVGKKSKKIELFYVAVQNPLVTISEEQNRKQ